mgnify:CR=1 FL=1
MQILVFGKDGQLGKAFRSFFEEHFSPEKQSQIQYVGREDCDLANPVAVEAMAEIGIDIANNVPKILTDDAVIASDVVITMGCGDTCKFYPGKRYEDWQLDDPAGQGIDSVRVIRDEIKKRVEDLLSNL